LTPDRRVRRLLPSHFLELQTFRSVRYWPTAPSPFRATREADAVVAAIGRRLRENVESMAGSEPLRISLTAGRDSRSVLAAPAPSSRHVQHVRASGSDSPDRLPRRPTHRTTGQIAARGCAVGRSLAARSGGMAGENRRLCGRPHLASCQNCEAAQRYRRARFGTCAEVGRAFHWRAGDFDDGRALSPEEIISRPGLPANGGYRPRPDGGLQRCR
jgi:hypothetical protein